MSISYAGELAAVAWSWAGPAGIDIEHDGAPVDAVGRQEWTRQEALFKAGSGARVTKTLRVPQGWVGTVAGTDVSWRLVGPAAPSR